MKARRKVVITKRIMNRFKNICLTFVVLFALQCFIQYTTKSVEELEISENEQNFGSFLSVNAAKKQFDLVEIEELKYKGEYCDKATMDCTFKNLKGETVEYQLFQKKERANGYVREWADGQLCISWAIVPGSSLMNPNTLAVCYLISMGYCFFGIAIISDIFMEAIESITAQTHTIEFWDKERKTRVMIDQPVWNATVANLTLMALGSSAPEIMLSVIGTVQDLEVKPSKLGPSTIVGSAAFNLLVISGLSIMAVKDGPKKVNDVGVFAVTSLASMWAYIWLFLVLTVWSPEAVSLSEGWWTLVFFFALIIFAYTADRVNNCFERKRRTHEQIEEQDRQAELNIQKNKLRHIARERGESVVLEIAQGMQTGQVSEVPDMVQAEIINLYREILKVNDVSQADINQLLQILQPDSLLERFAYRKRAGAGSNKEFIKLKGTKGQIDHDGANNKLEFENELLGFKCLHYSVTESNGSVEITIVKKQQQELTFGYRTVADSAVAPKDYTHTDKIVTLKKRDTELKIQIPIVDDDEWEPDLDFFVELYDPNHINSDTGIPDRLKGDDTRTKVTILDEDFPGSLGFEVTDVRVPKNAQKVDVTIMRLEGADGTISCYIRTEPLSEQQNAHNAVEFDDYLPKHEKVTFIHGENEKTISIDLVKQEIEQDQPKLFGEETGTNKAEGADDDESAEEVCDVIFKVKLEKPEPQEVKISKKNVCLVTIVKSDDAEKQEDERQKLLEFYLQQRDPTWGQQFKNAVMLGPQIDEDNLILEDVEALDAIGHFITITWKVVFATVPPISMWGGKAAFFAALFYIGLTTWFVGEMAELFGCVVGIDESVTAITFVALGTSLPDTFASMTAAKTSEFADAAIGNVTGSNSVNVFLGLGLPWAVATTYWAVQHPGKNYAVPAGAVAFSVFVFLIVAVFGFIILVGRRVVIGGELGGPPASRLASCVVFFILWGIYLLLSILNAQGVIVMNLEADVTG